MDGSIGIGISVNGILLKMKNHKRLLSDFYLNLLSIPVNDIFRITHQALYANVRTALAVELETDDETIQSIFERMAREDGTQV